MPLVRGANVTYTAGNDSALGLVTDGTNLYASSFVSPGRVIKSTISPFAQSAVTTLSVNKAIGIAVLGGFAFTTHVGLTISDANSGLVLKTDTSSMLEVGSTQLWSPGPTSRRQSVAIYSDGSFLYVGSNAYDPGTGWLDTQVTQMDSSFGSQTTVSLSTKGSTVAPSSVDGDGAFVYFAVGRGPTTDTTDSVVKLSTSGFAETAKWSLPSGTNVTDIISVPPKLYVGTTQGNLYRISTANMTSDGVVVSQPSGIGAMLQFGNILYVCNLDTGTTLFAYDIITYDRLGSIQVLSSAGPAVAQGVLGPNTQGTVQYWGTTSNSPSQIQQLKTVYTGASSTWPSSQQPTGTSGASGPISNYVPTTGHPIAFRTSNIQAGPGVTTQISSANPFIQAAMMGDPHFYGFEGESFFFNGEVGCYYNLFSDEGIQINTLFRYWETSEVENFTAMEEIGITIIPTKIPKLKNSKQKLFKKVDEIEIKVTANDGVTINGERVCDSLDPIFEFVDDLNKYFTDAEIEKFKTTEGYGTFIKAYIVRFWPYNFIITTCNDYISEYHPALNPPYLNIIARLDGATENRPHGVLGQTADFDKKPKEKLDGEEVDYKVSDLWSSDFKFNKFRR